MEISKKLSDCRRSLESLGVERGTPELQQKFLTSLAMEFHETTTLALKVDYSGKLFAGHRKLKLPTRITNRNDQFSADLQQYGHEHRFDESENDFKPDNTGKGDEKPEIVSAHGSSRKARSMNHGMHIRKKADMLELEDVLCDDEIIGEPSAGDILCWLGNMHHDMRGFALGTFEPGVMISAMQQQSKRWGSIALGYISDVIVFVDEYIADLVNTMCADGKVQQGLHALMSDELLKRYRKAVKKVKWLLQVEQEGHLITMNGYFAENLKMR